MAAMQLPVVLRLALVIYFFHKCMEVLVAVDAAAPQS